MRFRATGASNGLQEGAKSEIAAELAAQDAPRLELPLFKICVESLRPGRLLRSTIRFDLVLRLEGISSSEFLFLVGKSELCIGYRLHPGVSTLPAVGDLRAEVSRLDETSLHCDLSVQRSLFASGAALLAFVNPVYDNQFWFHQVGEPGIWLALTAPNTDVFQYYTETFNLGRDMT